MHSFERLLVFQVVYLLMIDRLINFFLNKCVFCLI